jgi:uncharacterized protein (DUF1697 family)
MYVAFLRGINVGGKTQVSMASLREVFCSLQLEDVATYINSGNVIFRAPSSKQHELEAKIEQALEQAYHLPIRVIVRSLQEMSDLIEHTPSSWEHRADKKCNVIFLHHSIDSPDIVRHFNPKPGIEEIYYRPGVLFWSADTSSLTRSTMIRLSVSSLYKYMTVRIYNTVDKVYALMQTADKQI